MQKTILFSASVFGALAVIIGAFGAHALKEKLGPDQLQVFETGVKYQFYHALALLMVGILFGKIENSNLNYAGIFFILGIVFFSGSLYLLSTLSITGLDGIKKILGPITPLGGLFFILGWISLCVGVLKSKML